MDHRRGYGFEAYSKELFDIFHLQARVPFQLVGEQIDGSFQLALKTYPLDAKWPHNPIGVAIIQAARQA